MGSTVALAYDPVELRRRIAISFSAPELRKLAAELGVSGQMAWDRGHEEAARDLVRQFERFYGLETLVAKLRELRPLLEWPEPEPRALPAAPAAPLEAAPPLAAPPLAAPPAPLSAPPLLASPGSLGSAPPLSASPGSLGSASPLSASPGSFRLRAAAPDDDGPVLPDPMVPPEPPAPAAAPSRSLPAFRGPQGSPEAAPPSKGLPPRLLLAGAGLVVLAVVVAFAAGRASTPAPDSAAAAASAAPPVEGAEGRRGDGPAARAAAALARAVAAVGRVCEVPAGSAKEAATLTYALAQCGPAPQRPRSHALSAPGGAGAPREEPRTPRPPPEGAQGRGRPAKGGDAAKDLPRATGTGCLGACDATLRSCKGRCGSEPTQSSQYEGYQLCQSRCLADVSRCRLACP